MLPGGQPPTVVFTEPAQLRDPKANETQMGAALFTKNGEGRNFDSFPLLFDNFQYPSLASFLMSVIVASTF